MRYKIFLLLTAGALAFLSCNTHDGEGLLDSVIGFNTRVTPTKALLSSLDHDDTVVKVYDYLSNFNGTIVVGGTTVTANQQEGEYFQYFSDDLIYPGGDGAWTYDSGNAYRWTRTGTHNFFGWLMDDAGNTGMNYQDFFGEDPDFDTDDMILSIPSKTLTTSSPQFDFLYAPKYSVASGSAGYGQVVPLQFSHLFTALKITIQNVSSNKVVLKSVTSSGIYNTKSAEIDFKNNTVSYDDQSAANFIPALAEEFTMEANPDGTLANASTYTLWDTHKIMWAQTGAELENATLLVTYDIYDNNNNPTEYTSTIQLNKIRIGSTPITSTGFEGGKKYTLTLQFKNGSIDLFPYVAPWDYTEESWDYAANSIAALSGTEHNDGVLILSKDGVNGTNYTMEITNTSEIVDGDFYIAAPHHGRWQVSLYPAEAAQYFTLEPSSGNINEDFIVNNLGHVHFQIKASANTPEHTVTAYFNISIYMGNEWHDANSEFNRKNWKIIRVVS